MAEVKWIKVVTDIFDDEKILLIETLPDADTIIVIWFKLLCLAGKQNNSGVFQFHAMPYTDEMFATIFRRPLNTVRAALSTFEKFGMIEIINDTVTIPNWEKHQNIDMLEKSREDTRQRVAAYRERQKALTEASNVTVTEDSNVTVTLRNATDKNRIDKNRLDNIEGEKRTRFNPPSIDEVQAYCEERKNGIDANAFIDFYESKNWYVGKNKMKDWRACIRTWESRRKEQPNKLKNNSKTSIDKDDLFVPFYEQEV